MRLVLSITSERKNNDIFLLSKKCVVKRKVNLHLGLGKTCVRIKKKKNTDSVVKVTY